MLLIGKVASSNNTHQTPTIIIFIVCMTLLSALMLIKPRFQHAEQPASEAGPVMTWRRMAKGDRGTCMQQSSAVCRFTIVDYRADAATKVVYKIRSFEGNYIYTVT